MSVAGAARESSRVLPIQRLTATGFSITHGRSVNDLLESPLWELRYPDLCDTMATARSTVRPRALIVAAQFSRVREIAGALRPRVQVESASTFADARARAAAEPPIDVVIIDEIDGPGALALCRSLVADGISSTTPVLLVTDCTSIDAQRAAIDAGASECLVRPMVPSVAQARVLGQIALTRQREQLVELETHDEETGVLNRRAFDRVLGDEWDRAVRRRVPLSLLLFEVDGLRSFRDAYGDSAATTALRQAASTIDASVRRPGDMCGRWSDHVLAVVLPETDNEGAGRVAERQRLEIERLHIPYPGSMVGEVVTVSVAAVSVRGQRGGDLADLERAARWMLDEARRRGSNRVVRATVEDLEGEVPIARVRSPRGVEYLAQLESPERSRHGYTTRMDDR